MLKLHSFEEALVVIENSIAISLEIGEEPDHSRFIKMQILEEYLRSLKDAAHENRSNGDLARAIENYSKALQLVPNTPQPDIYFLRGRAFYEAKQLEDSVKDLTACLKIIEDENFSSTSVCEEYAFTQGYRDLILELLPDIYRIRSSALSDLGMYEESLADSTQLIKLKPDLPTAYIFRGATLLENIGDLSNALKDFKVAINLIENSDEFDQIYIVHSFAGQAQARMNLFEEAILNYSIAIETDFASGIDYYNRGICFSALQNHENAIRDLTASLKYGLSYEIMVSAYLNRGQCLLDLRMNEEACDDFTSAIKLSPNRPELYHKRAAAFGRLQDIESGLSDFKMAAQLYRAEGNINKYLELKKGLEELNISID